MNEEKEYVQGLVRKALLSLAQWRNDMSLFSIDIRCDRCHEHSDIIVARAIGTDWDHKHECPVCHEVAAVRIMSAPRVFKEAYHDGYRRGGDYQLLKEANKLSKSALNNTGSARKELEKAAREIKQAARRERAKTE
jgi:hypothetical protein